MAKDKGKKKKSARQSQAEQAVQNSPYQCAVCGMTFDTREELLDHERTHMGQQVGKTQTSDQAVEKTKGQLSDRGDETVPWGEEQRGWTTGTGDREEGEITGRQTPGGRNAGFSSD